MTLSPGDSVGSSYRVVRLLGEGGMGGVYRLVEVLRGGKYSADAGKFRSYLATLIRRELVSRF